LSVADADVGGSAPAAAPQEPQPAPPRRPPHIDDVEPPRATGSGAAASEGPRPFSPLQQGAADPIELSLAIGIGRFEFRSSGERYDSRTDAVTFRVNAEPLRDGAGVELSGFLTDSTLFAGRTIHDGTSVVKADAQAFGIDMYPHVALQLDEGGPVRVPLRIGAFVDWLQLDHDAGGLDRTWFGFGARAQVLPELRLMERNARSLDLVGRLGGDLGGTWFHESFTTGDDSASTSRFGVEVGIGIRYRTGGLILDAGYRWILRHIGHTDTDLFGNVDGTETRLQELFLGIGGTF
jgi:opacity protein-like surface antigen